MLVDSLKEKIIAVDYCINYRKKVHDWGSNGCLGFPGATLLFSIADTLGSYFVGNNTFKIHVDGKSKEIRNTGDHLLILNSKYYGSQNLNPHIVKKLYTNYRSLLTHNSVLAFDHFMDIGVPEGPPFEIKKDANGVETPCVNLLPFLGISKAAVDNFISDLDSILPFSKYAKNIKMKQF